MTGGYKFKPGHSASELTECEKGGKTSKIDYDLIKAYVRDVESRTGVKLSQNQIEELKELFLEIGYGFINGSENNVNRIMDTASIRDFRLRKGDFEFYTDIEIYDDGKLIFLKVMNLHYYR